MFDQIAYDRGAELRREAEEYRRGRSRADRTAPRIAQRVAGGLRHAFLHRGPAPIGCEA